MKMKIMLLMFWILMASAALAQQEGLLIRTIPESDTLSIIGLTAITDNEYYKDYFQSKSPGISQVRLLDIYGNILADAYAEFPGSILIVTEETSKIKKIQIEYDGEIIDKQANFCNNNGVCEPCLENSCLNYENQISCGDCGKSSNDGFCNVEKDNICDIDCVGHIYDFPDIESTCFEDTLNSQGCEGHGYETCSETCISQIILEDGSKCCFKDSCIKNYSDPEFSFAEKSCSDFSWQACSETQSCSGGEIPLLDSGEICCAGTCNDKEIVDYIDGPIDFPEKRQISPIFYFLAGIVALVLLVGLYLWKRDITSILIIALVIISVVLILASRQNLGITGYVIAETQEEQIKLVCEVAKGYNLPSSTLLSLASIESNINHYRNGEVLITSDGGVGIMQIDRGSKADIPVGPFYACGNSLIDGRQLDAKKLKDNIECGALELIHKCESYDCLNSEKTYYCANTGTGLAPKNVVYKSWDIALRAYNGWGCGSTYYMNLWGPTDPRYIQLISAIQSYVEKFHEREASFENTCGDASGTSEVSGTVAEEISFGDILGYYYINPSFRAGENIDLKDIHDAAVYASGTLIRNVLNCYASERLSYKECARREISSKRGWSLDYCPNDEQESSCYLKGRVWDGKDCITKPWDYDNSSILKFCVDLGESILIYDPNTNKYDTKPLNLRFALTIAESGIKSLPDFEYDKIYETETEDEEDNLPNPETYGNFMVSDYTPPNVNPQFWRYYSDCLTGNNKNVAQYLNEAFALYPNLEKVGYTPALLMTECFVESSSGPHGCNQALSQGMCMVVKCPSEYPRCHENSEAGIRDNIMAAAKDIDEVAYKILGFKQTFGLTDKQMTELAIYGYNRGIGTIYGFSYKDQYLKGVKDYLSEGKSLEDSMVQACYNVYYAGIYGSCGGSKEWCCVDVGGLSYVKGTLVEYEQRVLPTLVMV